jgi:hypothetical protein
MQSSEKLERNLNVKPVALSLNLLYEIKRAWNNTADLIFSAFISFISCDLEGQLLTRFLTKSENVD